MVRAGTCELKPAVGTGRRSLGDLALSEGSRHGLEGLALSHV